MFTALIYVFIDRVNRFFCHVRYDFLKRNEFFPRDRLSLVGHWIREVVYARNFKQIHMRGHVVCARDAILVDCELARILVGGAYVIYSFYLS